MVERYLNDTASPVELTELENLLADPDADFIIKEVLYSFYHQMPEFPTYDVAGSPSKERIFQHIISQSQQHRSVRHIGTRGRRWLPYAAAVLFFVSLGLFTWKYDQYAVEQKISTVEVSALEIAPGTNRATLSLESGKTIALDESRQEIITRGGEITYSDGNSQIVNLGDEAPIETLVLSTPRGGTYAVTLPDGSTVWLNSATTLTYPSRFDDKERVVFLAGEAYFSVSAAKIPFKVVSDGQEVEVLGTEFNVSAYTDEREITTTLVAGRVQVSGGNMGGVGAGTPQGTNTKQLKPGEQAVNHAGTLHVKQVDVHPYTAWKNGLFYFDRLPPEAAITQLARWYDLEVIYRGKVPQVHIFGVIDRNKPLGSVLKSLEKSGLRFTITKADGINQLTVLGEQ